MVDSLTHKSTGVFFPDPNFKRKRTDSKMDQHCLTLKTGKKNQETNKSILCSWWLNQPLWKICRFVKLDDFPPLTRNENNTYLRNHQPKNLIRLFWVGFSITLAIFITTIHPTYCFHHPSIPRWAVSKVYSRAAREELFDLKMRRCKPSTNW